MKSVLDWAVTAEIGERMVYYRSWAADWDDGASHLARGLAMQAHEAGLVFLAQRRMREGAYKGQLQYEATRISKPTGHTLRRLQEPDAPRSESYRRVSAASNRYRELVNA